MNLLIITSHLPYPLNSGGNQAQFHFIEYMRDKININILYNENKINSPHYLSKLQLLWPNVHFFPYNWKKGKKRNITLIKKLERKLDKFFFKENLYTDFLPFEELNSDFFNFVLKTIRVQNINLIEIDFNDYLPLIEILPDNIKTVFVQHEIQFIRNFSSLKDNTPEQKFIYENKKNLEIAYMNKFTSVITLTDIDKNKLINNQVTVPIYTSPACVSSKIVESKHTYTDRNLVFIGGKKNYPNYHGILWFLENVWNILQQRNEKITLSIIGKWDTKEQKSLSLKYKNIFFLGFVEELEEVLNNSIMIVPILIGSGMRMKIIEAANHSCPFVTTTVGVEGLQFKDQEDCFITDKAEDFANNILKLLCSEQLQQQQANNIKDIYNQKYSINILGEKRLSTLNLIANE